MAEMTLEQKKALALAEAMRAREKSGQPPLTVTVRPSGYENRREFTPAVNSVDYGGTLEGTGRAIVQGGFAGLGDEVVAAGVAARQWLGENLGMPETFGSVPGRTAGEVYEASLNRTRPQLAAFQEDQPWLAYPAEIAGSIPTMLLGGGLQAMRAAQGLPLLARMSMGAGVGFGQGAAYGFNAGEGGPANRVGSALGTGSLAAALGAGMPFIGAGIGNLWRANLAQRGAQTLGTTPPAMQAIVRATGGDPALMADGAAAIRAAGPDAMLADASPALGTALDSAMQASGPAQAIGRANINQRVGAAGTQVTSALDTAFGAPKGVNTARSALRTGSQAARGDAYDAAYEKIIDYSSDLGREIEKIVATRVPPEAIAAANALLRAKYGRTTQQIMAEVANDGTVTFREMPDVRQLDMITRGLRVVAQQEQGKGALGSTSAMGAIFDDLASEIRGLVRQAVPEYATALRTAADPIGKSKALELGANALRENVPRDEFAAQLARLSKAEMAYVGQGIRSQIDETLAQVRRSVTDPNIEARQALKGIVDLSSDARRDKITAVVGKGAANQLFTALDQAAVAFELQAAVVRGSQTFARLATQGAMRSSVDDGVVNALRSGDIGLSRESFLPRLVQNLTGATEADKTVRLDAANRSLVELLTGPRGADALDALLRVDYARRMIAPAQQSAVTNASSALLSMAPAGGNLTRRLLSGQ